MSLKKIVNILFFSLVCVTLSAGKTDGLLQKAATSTIKASFQLYEVDVEGMVARGNITTCRGCYLLEISGGYTLYNDGQTKYTVNTVDKEVIVENMSPLDDVATVLRGDNYRCEGDSIFFKWKDGRQYRLLLTQVDFLESTDTSIYSPGIFSNDYIITDLR